MPEAHAVIYLLLALMQFLTGVFANGIIVVVTSISLIKQRTMAPLDLLLSCLATSRVFLQLLILLTHLAVTSLVKQSVLEESAVLVMFINELGLWLATWLGVFYCVKITTIAHPLFSWLKMKISKMVPWLILGSLICATISATVHTKCMRIMVSGAQVKLFSTNGTLSREIHTTPCSHFIIGLVLPLLIFLIAVLLLVFSLGRHTQQMRTIAVGTRDPSRSVHICAMLSILSFLILYVFHYMVTVLLIFQVFQFGSHIFLLCTLVVGAYPSAHSIILIFSNSKLKQNAKMFLLHGECCP